MIGSVYFWLRSQPGGSVNAVPRQHLNQMGRFQEVEPLPDRSLVRANIACSLSSAEDCSRILDEIHEKVSNALDINAKADKIPTDCLVGNIVSDALPNDVEIGI